MNDRRDLARDIINTGRMMLWEYGNQFKSPTPTKAAISINFLARSLRQLDALTLLVGGRWISDSWILYRSLLERYLLFRYLCNTGEFEVFDDWCYQQKYAHLNRIKSIRDFKGKPEMRNRYFTAQQKARYKRVSSDPRVLQWRRPDMETLTRGLGMKFLYDAGYDWASSSVHPVSTDGIDDYLILMGRPESEQTEDVRVLSGNACLAVVLHLQHFMNEPEFNWRKVLYNLVNEYFESCGGESREYGVTVSKVIRFHRSGEGLLIRVKPK